ncbi:hypothetical protein DdX_13434 [Ditylenchus destructor]|uniref:Ubiquitin-like protease family profile domain-containing protein n=1 Tax=Ditylenchus destructor TaxID=166010 RepID=A0AAD4MW82_9BILA|nr:hypothetical protein DdX_13434 [Ditylenchus destructor]
MMFVLFPLLMFGIMKLLSDIMLNDDVDQQERFQFAKCRSIDRNVNRKSFVYPQRRIQAQDTTCLITQASNTDTSLTDESRSDSENAQIVMPWREKLPDDLINTFCDKLGDAFNTDTNGRVVPNLVIEGFLAVQAVLIDLERRPKEITGQKRAFQIVLDQQAAHYVLLEWDTNSRCVRLYDSFAPDAIGRSVAEWRLTSDIKNNIIAMFGHLFDESTTTDSEPNIPVVIEDGLQQQHDAWSCGLHALGFLLLRIFDRSVQNYDVDLRDVLAFFNQILNSRRPSREFFSNAEFASKSISPRRYTPVMVLLDKNSRDVKIC